MKTDDVITAVVPEYKVVSDAPVARKLIRDGYKVADIKPKRAKRGETAFVFEVVPGFIEKMNEHMSEWHDKKNKAVEE